jgi:hypothetical protein
VDRTWIREVGDLGAALPAVIGLDRVAREKLVEVSLGSSGPAHGARCYLVVIGEGMSSAQVAIITGIVERVGSPDPAHPRGGDGRPRQGLPSQRVGERDRGRHQRVAPRPIRHGLGAAFVAGSVCCLTDPPLFSPRSGGFLLLPSDGVGALGLPGDQNAVVLAPHSLMPA